MPALVFYLWLLAGTIDPSQAPPEPLVAAVGGEVAMAAGAPARTAGGAAASLEKGVWHPVVKGKAVRLGKDGAARVLCGAVCRVVSGETTIGSEFCGQPRGPFCWGDQPQHRPTRRGGAKSYVLGSFDLLGNARGDREVFGFHPVLISPRCPVSAEVVEAGCSGWRDSPAEILFAAVDGAAEYRLSFHHPELEKRELRLEAASLSCAAQSEPKDLRICRAAWPASWRLPEARRARIGLAATLADGTWRPGQKPTVLARSDADGLPFSRTSGELPEPLDLLPEAAALLDADLPGEVVALLAGRTGGQPELELLLAQAFLQVDLPELAHPHFCRAFEPPAPAQPSARRSADVAVGLALSDKALSLPGAAAEHLEQAADLYRQLGEEDQAAFIAKLAAALQTPHPSP
jgi:hypothetical protein